MALLKQPSGDRCLFSRFELLDLDADVSLRTLKVHECPIRWVAVVELRESGGNLFYEGAVKIATHSPDIVDVGGVVQKTCTLLGSTFLA